MQCIKDGTEEYAVIGVVVSVSGDAVEWYNETDDRSIRRRTSKASELHRVGEVKLARKDLIK